MTTSPSYRKRLVVMVKEPVPGRVKTRLGKEIGMVDAAWWFRHQVRALLRRLSDPGWDLVLAVSPDSAGMASRVWPDGVPRIPQGAGDLGDRMGGIFRHFPPGPVIIIGADIPGITKTHIRAAFRVLGRKQAVFGPAPDGGYWLVGLRRSQGIPAGMFSGVRWSTRHALSDTVTSLRGLDIGYVARLRDVDTAADLRS